jgi:hypothetical protein
VVDTDDACGVVVGEVKGAEMERDSARNGDNPGKVAVDDTGVEKQVAWLFGCVAAEDGGGFNDNESAATADDDGGGGFKDDGGGGFNDNDAWDSTDEVVLLSLVIVVCAIV